MDDDWWEILGLLPVFGRQGRLVFEYVEKFGIKPLAIKSSKVLRILRQMGKLFESESFEWRKGNKFISKSGIVEALEIVNNKDLNLPLEDHNYLKKVMITVGEREAKEKSVRAERKTRKREGKRQRAEGRGHREEGEMSTGEFRERIGKLAGQMKGID